VGLGFFYPGIVLCAAGDPGVFFAIFSRPLALLNGVNEKQPESVDDLMLSDESNDEAWYLGIFDKGRQPRSRDEWLCTDAHQEKWANIVNNY